MARKVQKKTKKAPAKPASNKGKAAQKPAARARGKSQAESEVEQQWQTYWDCRKRLEAAVSDVRSAREALQSAQAAEHARRTDFDKIKSSVTKLLDVEPASSQARTAELASDPPQSPQSRKGFS